MNIINLSLPTVTNSHIIAQPLNLSHSIVQFIHVFVPLETYQEPLFASALSLSHQ